MGYWNYETHFGSGARVKLIRQRKYPEYKLVDLIGTVRTDSGSNVSVIFDGVKNTRSAYGCFYFKAVDLVEVEANEHNNKNMEENNMEIITNYINVVKVQYMSDRKPSDYKYVNFDPELKVGDVCITKYSGDCYGVAKVVEILDDTDVKTDREIVAKVDMSAYNQRVANRTKSAELKAKMEERAKQLQDIALYQLLAKDDSAMMELLKEYQAINNM